VDLIHVPESCNAWAIGTDLSYPTTDAQIYKGTISGAAPQYYCTWSAQTLSSDVSYGLALEGEAAV